MQTKLVRIGFLSVLVMLVFTKAIMAETARKGSVNSVTWDISTLGEQYFPETDDAVYKVPWLKDRKSFGIAFSGGGTRSASATLGQLRTLYKLGWLGEAKYISAISGGAWASVPYTYYSNKDDNILLGDFIPPKKLMKNDFEKTKKGSLAEAIAKSSVGLKAINSWFSLKKDETFSSVISKVFLKRFDLHDNRFFAFHKESVKAILDNNPSSNFSSDDFYTVKNGRPYLLVGGTFISKDVKDSSSYYPLEMSGLYTGIRQNHSVETKKGTAEIGGGYVQPFAYDTNTPLSISDGNVQVPQSSKRRMFTLADVVGITGSAPQHVLRRVHIKDIGFPELKYWAIGSKNESLEYPHADGGHLENLGLMPLLVRQVENILVFANSYKPLNESKILDIKSYFTTVDSKGLFAGYQNNKVFEEHKFDALKKSLIEKIGKESLVHCDNYQVLKNDHYGIASYNANICWVYLNKNEEWINQLSQQNVGKKVVKRLEESESSFKRFPHYKTFLENPPYLINLSNIQVNALAHLTSWELCKSQKTISDALVGDGLKLSIGTLKCD